MVSTRAARDIDFGIHSLVVKPGLAAARGRGALLRAEVLASSAQCILLRLLLGVQFGG